MKTVKGLTSEKSDITSVYNPYFDQTDVDYIYRAAIEIYGSDLSGLLIIKKIGKNHRVVMTTEFGSKIFDFEFIGKEFKVLYVEDKLDRSVLINTLKKDFQLLLNPHIEVANRYKSGNLSIYLHHAGKYKKFYFLDESKKLEKIIRTKASKEQVIIEFNREGMLNSSMEIAESIDITHKNLKLKIALKILPN